MSQDQFDTQVREHLPKLRRKAYRMTRHHQDAEDLYQETLLKAYRSFHTFEQGTNLAAWLFTIMKHAYINHYRKRKREPMILSGEQLATVQSEGGEQELEWTPIDHDAHSIEDIIIGDDLADTLTQVINDLPDSFRDTYVMFEHQGRTYREIAARQDIAIGTVMSRLSRARKRIREAMSDQLVSA